MNMTVLSLSLSPAQAFLGKFKPVRVHKFQKTGKSRPMIESGATPNPAVYPLGFPIRKELEG